MMTTTIDDDDETAVTKNDQKTEECKVHDTYNHLLHCTTLTDSTSVKTAIKLNETHNNLSSR